MRKSIISLIPKQGDLSDQTKLASHFAPWRGLQNHNKSPCTKTVKSDGKDNRAKPNVRHPRQKHLLKLTPCPGSNRLYRD